MTKEAFVALAAGLGSADPENDVIPLTLEQHLMGCSLELDARQELLIASFAFLDSSIFEGGEIRRSMIMALEVCEAGIRHSDISVGIEPSGVVMLIGRCPVRHLTVDRLRSRIIAWADIACRLREQMMGSRGEEGQPPSGEIIGSIDLIRV